MPGYTPINLIPGPMRKIFGWIERLSGLHIGEGPPRFERGLFVGGTFLDEAALKRILVPPLTAEDGLGDLLPDMPAPQKASAKK